MSRLTGYDHLVGAVSTNSFTENDITYDANGNIQNLRRYGSTSTTYENFSYLYSGNQLSTVNGQNYTYDPNGNMVMDGQNNRMFSYNHLNLISTVQNASSSASYRWLADGTKASVVDDQGYGFEYFGSFVYQKTPTNLALESVSFGAGRFVANSIGYVTPNYYITDHLGSVRVVFTSPTNIIAQNDYYAFGLRHSNPNLAQNSANRYLFNRKELQVVNNLGLLDYGARPYDPNTGRWINIDPLAEQFLPISSYAFSGNNPVKFIDRDGRSFGKFTEDDWYEYLDKEGNTKYRYEDRQLSDREMKRDNLTWIGITGYTRDGSNQYLSLFGEKFNTSTSNGNSNIIAEMVRNLDRAIINYYKADYIIRKTRCCENPKRSV